MESETTRKIAVDCFNNVWKLMEKTDRTQKESDTMLHMAHASRYHWEQVGTEIHLARGEWQVSRVYSVLHRSEPALYHAQRCLDICQQNGIGDFDLAYAYEALARGSAVAGNVADRDRYLALAQEAGTHIAEDDDREMLLKDLETVRDAGG